jgi:ABC-type sugar transport system permease subunit
VRLEADTNLHVTENLMTETSNPPTTTASGSRIIRVILGLLLVVPAAAACLLTFFLPSLQLVLTSFSKVSGFGPAQPVGLTNYAHLGEMLAGGSLSMTAALMGVRLIAVLIVPPLLALGISRSLPALQIGARLLLTIPLALFAPFLTMLIWFLISSPEPSPAGFRGMLLQGDGLITLTLACAATLPAYLAALRRPADQPPDTKMSWRPFATVWAVSLLAVVALSAQAFGLSYMVQGGPARSTETLALVIYRQAFQYMQFGAAAALGTPLLAFIMLVGLAAGAVVARSGLSLQTAAAAGTDQEAAARTRSILIGVGMLVLGLGCVGLSTLPYATQAIQAAAQAGSGASGVLDKVNTGASMVNTILPQLLGVFLFQLPLTYLAALGIGGVRPFGRRSELLLLPFSPWLFATVGPLLGVFYLAARDTKTLNTFVALLPRFAISIPILFILTLFFKGQEMKRQVQGDSTFKTVLNTLILPSLPLALLLGLAALLVGMQSLAWPLVATHTADLATIPVQIVQVMAQFASRRADVGALASRVELPIFVIFALVFAVFQVFYLPRLLLARSGPEIAADEPESSEASSSSKGS